MSRLPSIRATAMLTLALKVQHQRLSDQRTIDFSSLHDALIPTYIAHSFLKRLFFLKRYIADNNMHKLFLHPPRPNLSCQCNAREQMNIQRPGLLLARPRTAPHRTAPAASVQIVDDQLARPGSVVCGLRACTTASASPCRRVHWLVSGLVWTG